MRKEKNPRMTLGLYDLSCLVESGPNYCSKLGERTEFRIKESSRAPCLKDIHT